VLKDGSGFNPLRRQEVAIHKSVIKRQKQADTQQLINKSAKSMLKTLAKKVEQAVEAKNADVAKAAMVNAMKAYDKAASKGILHKSTASRKISRLSTKVGKITAA
jgi:small subunit ribosomal protein S20